MNDYDSLAIWYDLLLGDWNKTVESYINLLKEILIQPYNNCAFDIACGTGIYLAALNKMFKLAFGIDISKNMLKIAKKNLLAMNQKAHLIRSSWLDLPISNSTNSTIVCMGNSLAHCLDDISLSRVLTEFRRIIGNGQIIIDSRNMKQLSECPNFRKRGCGIINGKKYSIYDTWSFISKNIYQILLIVKRIESTNEKEIFRTILKYRTDLKLAVLSIAPNVGLKVQKCIGREDLGDLFDLIILSLK